MRNIGIAQVRTPFRSPRANAIAERWVRSVRTECLEHVFTFNERHLQKVLAEYVGYFNDWRPHRSMGQRAPYGGDKTAIMKISASSSGIERG
jgi:transposase InsO family protein